MKIKIMTISASFLFSQFALSYDCTHFVDAVDGSDAETGLTSDDAWKTIDKVIGLDFNEIFEGGEVICFKRGQTFYRKNNGHLKSSGTENNPIVYTHYGDPADPLPVLTMSEAITDTNLWSVSGSNGAYEMTLSGSVGGELWEDDVPLPKDTTSSALANGEWYRGSNTLFYRPSSVSGTPSSNIYFSKNSQLFVMKGLSHRVFDGFNFKYISVAFYGRSEVDILHDITVKNSEFNNVRQGVWFESWMVSNEAKETHSITVSNNTFDNIRFAAKFSSVNGTPRALNLTISNNTVSNVAIDGAYTQRDPSPDIEAFSFQNIHNTVISGNEVRHGVKVSDGLTNHQSEALLAHGISIWHHPTSSVENVLIEGNFFDDLNRGIILGAGSAERISNVVIANNILTNNDSGLRLNSGDSDDSSKIINNTLHNNGISIDIGTNGSGYNFINNISSEPTDYHIEAEQHTAGESLYNHNLYSSSFGAPFKFTGTEATDLSAWIAALGGGTQEASSVSTSSAGFISATPTDAVDYKLSESSEAVSNGLFLPELGVDFELLRRDGKADIGAYRAD